MRLIALLPLALAACTSASAATRGFPVGGFDRIRSSVPFDVRVHTGSAPSVVAEGPQEALDRLKIEVRGGELVIGTTPGGWFSGWHLGHGRAVITVGAPAISAAALSGPGNLDIDRVQGRSFAASVSGPGDMGIGQLETGHADLSLSGRGDLTVAGRAGSARMAVSGPGDIRAAKLMLRDASITVSGPGDVSAYATGTADVTLSGPGDVTVTGGARCSVTKHGPGDVTCR